MPRIAREIADGLKAVATARDFFKAPTPELDFELWRLLKVGGSTLRAEMAGQLASNPNAPPHTIRGLAYDPAPNIAGPVLKQSRSLPDVTIAEMARCKDEDHLVAIAARANLDSHITGILTRRGSVRVLSVLASNRTASFSEQGIQRLRKFRREQRSAISRPSGRHTAH